MASSLSQSAVRRIIFLVENDDRPTGKTKKIKARRDARLERVNGEWGTVYKLYRDMKPEPPLGYLDSLGMALVIKGKVDDEDVRAIFAHGKPLEFWGCPRLIVSKIVGAFCELQKEPECLDVTITPLFGLGVMNPLDTWPQVYATYLPCYACTTVEAVERRSIPRWRDPKRGWSNDPDGTTDFVVEKFHISSKSFGKHLTVELHYRLEGRTVATQGRLEQSSLIHKATIHLASETCSANGSLCAIANRSSATLLLLPDFASEVFGFLERAHVGPSLLANRELYDLICQLKQRLPLHRVTCALEKEKWGRGMSVPRYTGAYWLTVRRFQRDFSYTDVRRFRMPCTARAVNDCALIRHYLSNSHAADLLTPSGDFPFAIKMLASLATRNFSVGCVKLYAETERLSDYRSMDAIFGGLRMGILELRCEERRFVELVKTTDFFRMSTVQRLRELKLTLTKSWDEKVKTRDRTWSKSPLWVSGIHLLRNCDYYLVDYKTDRHLPPIERNVVRICEEFERGTITDTVEQFELKSDSSAGMNYAFSRDNLLVSGMKAEVKTDWGTTDDFEWDVYRFRNARTSEYLTACVGRNTSAYATGSILRIAKGEVYPDAFAKY